MDREAVRQHHSAWKIEGGGGVVKEDMMFVGVGKEHMKESVS